MVSKNRARARTGSKSCSAGLLNADAENIARAHGIRKSIGMNIPKSAPLFREILIRFTSRELSVLAKPRTKGNMSGAAVANLR